MRGTREDNDPPEIDPPEVSVTLLKASDLLKEQTPWSKVPHPIDILLMTKEECELLSCISCLNVSFCKSYHEELGDLYFGEDETIKLKIAVIKYAQAGHYYATDFAQFVNKGLEVLNPKALLCVGYCGGLNCKKAKLGDVVVSNRLLIYTSKPTRCTLNFPMNRDMQAATRNVSVDWRAPLKVPGELDVKVHTNGVFLCGPEAVDSVERRDELTHLFPEATAIAEEGFGKSFIVAVSSMHFECHK